MKIPLVWKLVALLVGTPLLDMGTILLMSRYVGPWATFGTVVACGLLGVFLVRREGLRTYHTLRHEIAAGQMPETPLLDGVIVLLSGALLMTPGPLTDLLGLILLVPAVRNAIRLAIRARVEKMLMEGAVSMVQRVTVR